MGKVYMKPCGGGGTSSSDVTASKADVLKGKKTVTSDSNDEIAEGTMTNNGAVSYKLPANGSYTIPKGYHNGSGKVTQSLSTQGAKTITPSTSKQTVSVNGKLMTGDIVVNPIPNLKGQYQMAGGWGSGGSGADAYYAMNAMPEGYYQKNGADWAPEVRMKQSDVRSALGITASKIVSGQSIAGVSGTALVSSYDTSLRNNQYKVYTKQTGTNVIWTDIDADSNATTITLPKSYPKDSYVGLSFIASLTSNSEVGVDSFAILKSGDRNWTNVYIVVYARNSDDRKFLKAFMKLSGNQLRVAVANTYNSTQVRLWRLEILS